MLKKLEIVCVIETEDQAKFFKGFVSSIAVNFFRDIPKTIHVFSNDIFLTDSFTNGKSVFMNNERKELLSDLKVDFAKYQIESKPTPLGRLLTPSYIAQVCWNTYSADPNKGEDIMVFYLDPRIEINGRLDMTQIDPTKLNVVCDYRGIHFPSDYYKMQTYINNRLTNANIESDYNYWQFNFLGGNISEMFEFASWADRAIKNDLSNCRIPQGDVEAYLNKYIFDNSDRAYCLSLIPNYGCKEDSNSQCKNPLINLRIKS